jgi:hypothetical protein
LNLTKKKEEEVEYDFIIRSFVSVGCPSVMSMQHALERQEMNRIFYSENLKGNKI